jgi:hypothetical protein
MIICFLFHADSKIEDFCGVIDITSITIHSLYPFAAGKFFFVFKFVFVHSVEENFYAPSSSAISFHSVHSPHLLTLLPFSLISDSTDYIDYKDSTTVGRQDFYYRSVKLI